MKKMDVGKSDDGSSELCIFNSPWGEIKFLHPPFGIRSASEFLQQKNNETFQAPTCNAKK